MSHILIMPNLKSPSYSNEFTFRSWWNYPVLLTNSGRFISKTLIKHCKFWKRYMAKNCSVRPSNLWQPRRRSCKDPSSSFPPTNKANSSWYSTDVNCNFLSTQSTIVLVTTIKDVWMSLLAKVSSDCKIIHSFR